MPHQEETSSSNINRLELVKRHNITWNESDAVLPVGNGEFSFGVDATGLQTFSGFTMAHWGWHSFPLPDGIQADDIPTTGTFMQGVNNIPEEISDDRPEIAQWMFDNPHRMKLGRIFFCDGDGKPLELNAVKDIDRHLDLWMGQHHSTFSYLGEDVSVKTLVHPKRDLISVLVDSKSLSSGQLKVGIIFEYPTLKDIADIKKIENKEGTHQSRVIHETAQEITIQRRVDDKNYQVALEWCDRAKLITVDAHSFILQSNPTTTLEFSCEFKTTEIKRPLPKPSQSKKACEGHWQEFWNSGAAIDLSESKDPRWRELERRIVLSQYHMGCQSSGSWPSPEIGLMGMDPWRSQFHMEMAWWHLAHYALWGRWDMAEKALGCYQTFLPSAKALAKQLGYRGAMWPKSVGPEGRSATWGGNTALLWKQPHPIFFAELEYRLRPTGDTLKKWAEIIEETAEHMASYPVWDEDRQCASLIPCVPPSETGKTRDGVFDLAYWHWGLGKAQEWRERMGKSRHQEWDEVCDKLPPLPVIDGVYVRTDQPGTRHNQKLYGHPDPVGIFGMLPLTKGVDPEVCGQTVRKIWETWDWTRCWGWDFPWTAMAAARTGQPELAVDALLKEAEDRNYYDETGLNLGGPTYYLPGNGGLLYAVAMMAAGWEGGPQDEPNPGFPKDGSWVVKWEGLNQAI